MENHHHLVGYISLEKVEYEAAVEHLKQADQQDPYTLYLMAAAESKAGNEEKAAALLKELAEWNQNSLNYAFVRPQAMMAVEEEMAAKE
jgi:tetratricopeptide (TPR) repeat protein